MRFMLIRLLVKIGNAAIVELDTYIGDVWCFCHYSNAAGINVPDIAFHKAENNIYIMDHQVEYNTHFCTTG